MFRVFNLKTSGSPSRFYPLLRSLELIRKNRGPIFLIKYVKDIRVAFLNYLANSEVKVEGVKVTKDGIPIIFGDLIQTIRKEPSPEFLQVINTILFCTRALNLGTKVDYSPIISPAKQEPHDIGIFIKSFWKELGYRPNISPPRALRWKKFHLSTKVGPNSENDNALYRSLCDLSSLPSDLMQSIINIGGPKLEMHMMVLLNGLGKFPVLQRVIPFFTDIGSIRKLSSIKDKELKVRVIAIGDYFSQTSLLPLHNYLFKVLKKIPQDCTFGQDKGPQKIINNKFFSSIDLTNATDRFPISLISDVLAGNLPQQYVTDWKNIMVGYPFDSKEGKIFYSVGNPMGFYSSWASFAVSHHYLIYYCCRKLNISWKHAPYCLLGDDIVICNRELAALYKETIKILGVESSASKTYESQHFFEFAKRIFWKGKEISPFPISGLKEVSQKYYLLTQFFIEAEKKGYVSCNGVPAMVDEYYSIVLGLPSKFRNKLVKLASIYECVQRIVRGSDQAGVLLSKALGLLGHHLTVSDFVARNVLENIAVELFADSNPATNWEKWSEEGKITLTQFESELLITAAMDPTIPSDQVSEFICAIPAVGVTINIFDAFKDLSKEAEGYSNSTNGVWPLLLKATAFPLSKDILVHRSSFLISRTASKIARFLKDRALILEMYDPEELLRTTP